MSVGEMITAIIVALCGTGGAAGIWLTKRHKESDPLHREDVEKAEAKVVLDQATVHVTAALVSHIDVVKREVKEELAGELRTMREELENIKTWRSKIKAWWREDVIPNWHEHREKDYPPDMPF